MKITIEQRNTDKYYYDLYKLLASSIEHVRARCNNKNYSQYKDYGEKGVTYDPKWNLTANFIKDADHIKGWNTELFMEHKLQLDKDILIQGNLYYSKDTCLWVTSHQNMVMRPSKMKAFYGYNERTEETILGYSKAAFADLYNISPSQVSGVLNGRKHQTGEWYLWYTDSPYPLIYEYEGIFRNNYARFHDKNAQRLSLKMGLSRTYVASRMGKQDYYSNNLYIFSRSIVDLSIKVKGLETKFPQNQRGSVEEKWIRKFIYKNEK